MKNRGMGNQRRMIELVFFVALFTALVILKQPSTQMTFYQPVFSVHTGSRNDPIIAEGYQELSTLVDKVHGIINPLMWQELSRIEEKVMIIAHGTQEGIQLREGFLTWEEFDQEIISWNADWIILVSCYSDRSADPRVLGVDGLVDAGLGSVVGGINFLSIEARLYYKNVLTKSVEKNIHRILAGSFSPLLTESGYTSAFKFQKTSHYIWFLKVYNRILWFNTARDLTVDSIIGFVTFVASRIGGFLATLFSLSVIPLIVSLVGIIIGYLGTHRLSRAAGGYSDVKFGIKADTLGNLFLPMDNIGIPDWNIYLSGPVSPLAYSVYEAYGAAVSGYYSWDRWYSVNW